MDIVISLISVCSIIGLFVYYISKTKESNNHFLCLVINAKKIEAFNYKKALRTDCGIVLMTGIYPQTFVLDVEKVDESKKRISVASKKEINTGATLFIKEQIRESIIDGKETKYFLAS